MVELLKRLLLIAGIGVLFVLTSMLIGEANKYGTQGPEEVGLWQYLGLKKAPSPSPEARPVNSLEEPKKDYERGSESQTEPSPSTEPELLVGDTQTETVTPPSESPAAETSNQPADAQYYFDSGTNQYIQYQAPRDSF